MTKTQSEPGAGSPAVHDLFSLRGTVALVTGGSRGLGKEMALALAEAGAAVAITARRAQWLDPTAAEFAARQFDCLAIRCDVTAPDQVSNLAQQVIARYGRIDVLINNAGMSWGAPSAEMPLERWQAVLDLNATGTFMVTQEVGRRMIRQGGGKIINISSIMGLRGTPPGVVSAIGYSVTKGGIIALTRALAVEWAQHGITVNAIAPGFFPTRMSEQVIDQHGDTLLARIPLGRFGKPDDIRALAVFLAAPAADYITGQVISLDGGATAS